MFFLDYDAIFGPPRKPPPRAPADLPPEWREVFEERAAIREFDGGAPSREVAERDAMAEVVGLMAAAPDRPEEPNPVKTSPGA